MVTAAVSDKVIPLYGSKNDQKPLVYNGVKLEQGSSFVELDGDKIWMLFYDADTDTMIWKEFT